MQIFYHAVLSILTKYRLGPRAMHFKARTNGGVAHKSFLPKGTRHFKESTALSSSISKIFLGSRVYSNEYRRNNGKNVTCIAEKLQGATSSQLNSRVLKYKYELIYIFAAI